LKNTAKFPAFSTVHTGIK